jgi:hypothetical protein
MNLASCDPNAPVPPEAAAWQRTLKAAGMDEEAYAEALAKSLKDLVCSGRDNVIHVVHGLSQSTDVTLADTGGLTVARAAFMTRAPQRSVY